MEINISILEYYVFQYGVYSNHKTKSITHFKSIYESYTKYSNMEYYTAPNWSTVRYFALVSQTLDFTGFFVFFLSKNEQFPLNLKKGAPKQRAVLGIHLFKITCPHRGQVMSRGLRPHYIRIQQKYFRHIQD